MTIRSVPFMRRLRYHLWYLNRSWLALLFAPVEYLVWKRMKCESFEGIEIVDSSLRRWVDQRFTEDTIEALRLIQSVDPRRFRRIQREVKYVVNGESFRFASYGRTLRACAIDYGIYDLSKNREWYLWWYAKVLVHEATHGAIDSRHIGYTVALRGRVERLCHIEAKRFATRADTAERLWSESLCGQFDERNWHPAWNRKPTEAFKHLLARLREEQANMPK